MPSSEPPTAAHDLPAGVDPAELAARPGEGMRRGSVRRRVRYLRAVRELLLRDLGGFSYELHRTAGGNAGDAHRRLLETKTARLAALDAELRELEGGLGEPHPDATVLRRPGIGGTCPQCGELHGSEAAFCWHCGTALTERAVRRRATAVPPQAGGHGVVPSGAREAATDEHPTGERLALWIKSTAGDAQPAPEAGEQAPAQPAPAAAAEPVAAPAPAPAPGPAAAEAQPASDPVAAPKRPAKKRPKAAPKDAPADEQPTAAQRPAERPAGLSDGDPLATPGERRS